MGTCFGCGWQLTVSVAFISAACKPQDSYRHLACSATAGIEQVVGYERFAGPVLISGACEYGSYGTEYGCDSARERTVIIKADCKRTCSSADSLRMSAGLRGAQRGCRLGGDGSKPPCVRVCHYSTILHCSARFLLAAGATGCQASYPPFASQLHSSHAWATWHGHGPDASTVRHKYFPANVGAL